MANTLFNKFSGELPESRNNFREVKLVFYTSRKFLLLSRSSFRELNFPQKLIKHCTNHYDRIFKENIEPMIPFIARRLFGLEMITQSEDLKDKLQYTLEKEADYLQRIIHTNPSEDFILHVECQVKDDKEMLSRMFLY